MTYIERKETTENVLFNNKKYKRNQYNLPDPITEENNLDEQSSDELTEERIEEFSELVDHLEEMREDLEFISTAHLDEDAVIRYFPKAMEIKTDILDNARFSELFENIDEEEEYSTCPHLFAMGNNNDPLQKKITDYFFK